MFMRQLCLGPRDRGPARQRLASRLLHKRTKESSMAISMASASLPIFRTMLGNLSHILDKGLAHAQARKFDPSVLAGDRLAPDMLPFTRQIQIACDSAKNGVARLAGVEAPKFEDDEQTFE